jgi:hypothetical protein
MFIAAAAGDQTHVGRDWRLLWDTSGAGRPTCSANWTDVTLSRSGTVESPVTSRQGTPATSRAMSRAGLRSPALSETLRSPQSRPQESVRPARWFSLRAVPVGWRRTDPAQKAEAGVLRPVGCHPSREPNTCAACRARPARPRSDVVGPGAWGVGQVSRARLQVGRDFGSCRSRRRSAGQGLRPPTVTTTELGCSKLDVFPDKCDTSGKSS